MERLKQEPAVEPVHSMILPLICILAGTSWDMSHPDSCRSSCLYLSLEALTLDQVEPALKVPTLVAIAGG